MKQSAVRSVLLVASLVFLGACGLKRHPMDTPLITNSQQPDKELFDRATNFLEHSKFMEARLLLQTLINTYPDSEYLAKAKLAIGDSWYRQGGSSDLTQAEAEYRDFITFFPTMPEAAEAQMRVAMIHYREMEKPDRDSTHARRAEQEFQKLLMNYPNGPFAPLAEQRLREVQEVLAGGAYEVAHFYYLQGADRAAQPRLKELVDRYPNFSDAPAALLVLGRSIERSKGKEGALEAAGYYQRIARDYPLSDEASDAKDRLKALNQPVPDADPVAVARMTYERTHSVGIGMWDSIMGGLHRHPNVAAAQGRIGPPTLTAQGAAQAGALPATAGDTGASAPLPPPTGMTIEPVPAPAPAGGR